MGSTVEVIHLLEVEDLDVFYGPIQALRGVSLHVGAGEMVALLGANGAGKTTTLRAISGMLSPRRGHIIAVGREITGMASHQVVRCGLTHLPEGRELFPTLTVLENLRMGYWPRRGDKAGFEAALDRVFALFSRLEERRSQAAGTLSGGEQQMLGVARALMSDPQVLLIDELSLGLAPKVVDELFDKLREVNATGMAMLLVEQFVEKVLPNTARGYVLAKGEVVASGASMDLLHDRALAQTYLGGELVGAESH